MIARRLQRLENKVDDEKKKSHRLESKVHKMQQRARSATGTRGDSSVRSNADILDNLGLSWMSDRLPKKRERERYHDRFQGPVLSGHLSVATWQPNNIHRLAKGRMKSHYSDGCKNVDDTRYIYEGSGE